LSHFTSAQLLAHNPQATILHLQPPDLILFPTTGQSSFSQLHSFTLQPQK